MNFSQWSYEKWFDVQGDKETNEKSYVLNSLQHKQNTNAKTIKLVFKRQLLSFYEHNFIFLYAKNTSHFCKCKTDDKEQTLVKTFQNCLSLGMTEVLKCTNTFSSKYKHSHEERLRSLNHLSTRADFTILQPQKINHKHLFNDYGSKSVPADQTKVQGYSQGI